MGLWNNIASRSRSKSDGADPFAAGLPIGHDNNPNIPEIIDPKHPLQCTENGLRDEMGLPKRESYRRLCGFHESSVSSRLRVSPKRRRCAFPEGCAHCASPWICSGASWVCSRFLGLLALREGGCSAFPLPHCPRCPCCLRAARAAEPNLEPPLRTWPAEGPRGQRRPAIDGQSRGVKPEL